jgi:hypothetical protein
LAALVLDNIFPRVTLFTGPKTPVPKWIARLKSAPACIAALMSFPAAAIPDIEAIVPPGTQSERYYVTQEWTLNYLANLLYLDFDKLAEVKLVRGLSNFDICTMPESRLQRAIVKAAELMPDSPGEAASFRERQRWGSNGKADPMRLSNALAAREAMGS